MDPSVPAMQDTREYLQSMAQAGERILNKNEDADQDTKDLRTQFNELSSADQEKVLTLMKRNVKAKRLQCHKEFTIDQKFHKNKKKRKIAKASKRANRK